MKKFKIIVDSSSDLTNQAIQDEEIDFEVVPLTIHIKDREFYDNDALDTKEMLDAMHASTTKNTTSCPAPGSFLEAFNAEYNFCITITSKLSGTFNSARMAMEMSDNKCFIIDSKGTCGSLSLIVDQLVKLIKMGKSYEEICKEIIEFRDQINLLFVLDRFDNLVKNGRMSRITSIIAGVLHIKPLCEAVDGEIKVSEKPRTRKLAFKRMVEVIGEKVQNFSERDCVISYCENEALGQELAETIKEKYSFKSIVVRKMRGLASFYALEDGVIVCF